MYAMKKLFIILTIFSVMSLPLMAEDGASELNHGRHSLRLGWGLGDKFLYSSYNDLIYVLPPSSMRGASRVSFSEEPYYIFMYEILGMTTEEAHEYLMNRIVKTYSEPNQFGHLFLSYRYGVNSWLSAGVEVDWLYLSGNEECRNGYGEFVVNNPYGLHQLTIMPSIRFTYFRRPLVELYSGLDLGYTIYAHPYVSHGFTIYPALFGVNVGNEHWFAEVELGTMLTLATPWIGRVGLLFSSRMVSAAVGYRF